jgi:hypothetical protein
MSSKQKDIIASAKIVLENTERCGGCGRFHFTEEQSNLILDAISIAEEFEREVPGLNTA